MSALAALIGAPATLLGVPVLVTSPEGSTAPIAAAATVPPADGQIVFVGAGFDSTLDLYAMSPDGTGVSRITTGASPLAVDAHPAWSPDGARIAFASDRDGSSEIYAMNANGTDIAQLTSNGANDSGPSWAPDGSRIVLARRRAVDAAVYSDLVTVAADGSTSTPLTSENAVDIGPDWSPDGSRIAFARDGLISTINADGSGEQTLVASVPAASSPAWSPDGARIAFSAAAGSRSDLYVVNADGTGLRELTGAIAGGREPRWTADGSRLLFVGSAGSTSTISTIAPDGSCPAQLLAAPSGGSVDGPDWQRLPGGQLGIWASAACATVQRGSRATYTINLTRSGLTDPVALTVTGLPAATSAGFGPNPAWLNSATLTIGTSECPATTPLGTYTLTVAGSAGGVTRSSTINLVVHDGPPIVAAPTSSLYAGGTEGSTTTPVRTRWSACDHEAISGYTVDRYYGGTWSQVASGSTTSISQLLLDGYSYRYRARAADASFPAGGAWSYGHWVKPMLIGDASSSLHYGGTWYTALSTSYLGGSEHYAVAAGASASYAFAGSSIAWVVTRGPTRGSAYVYVDGAYRTTISLYASTFAARKIVYATNWAAPGRHSIKLIAVGTAGHPRVDLDAFVLLPPTDAYVLDTYNGHMTTESPENITCVSASALTTIDYASATVQSEYYSHLIAAAWYGQVRSSTQDFHDKYDYTNIEPGLDPRGWAWLLWAHAAPGHGYHDYWGSNQATLDSWIMWNVRNASEPAGAVIFRSVHAVDVVGFSSSIDPRNGTSGLNGFYIVDPWYPNSKKTMADGGTLGLAPNTYLTLATWNASYFTPYVDSKYEAVHGPNLWHDQFVAVLRTVDGTPEPTKTYDTMPARYTGGSTTTTLATAAAADAIYPDAQVRDAIQAGIVTHGLDSDGRLGLTAAMPISIGRRLDVDSLSPDFPPYSLVEVIQGGRVAAIAMLTRTEGGLQFAGLQSAYPGNAVRDPEAVRQAFVAAGFGIQRLSLEWLPSMASFQPFSPLWVGTDALGRERFLTPAGEVTDSLPRP